MFSMSTPFTLSQRKRGFDRQALKKKNIKGDQVFKFRGVIDIYTRIHAYVWKIIFSSSFKKFGKNSRIIFPMEIKNVQYMEIGDQISIAYKAWLVAIKKNDIPPYFIIEDGTRIGHFSVISCLRHVHIGKKVLIADKVFISDNVHGYEDITLPIMDQPLVFKGKVYIGDNSWIGQNVCIIGARIGKHCVIGANSVVTRDIPDYCVAAGAPARVIRRLC